jgi:hypothetical protein
MDRNDLEVKEFIIQLDTTTENEAPVNLENPDPPSVPLYTHFPLYQQNRSGMTRHTVRSF